ncbi:MAG: serine hydrolase domain-containing protein, partial [Anaerolineae bacterium]
MANLNSLNTALEKIVARWGIPRLAVGIVQAGEIVHARAFGVQSLATRAPVTLDSIFCVASVSKVFVATAVMQLAERGLIDLEAPVVRYVPYFRLDDPADAVRCYARITTRQLLSHTAGMPHLDEFEYYDLLDHPECDKGAAERYVCSLSNRALVSEPGTRFLCSNIGYDVLGALIARVTTGRPFEAYLREQVLAPAGMPDSTFLLAEVSRDWLAVPHLRAPGMMVAP